MLAGRMERRAMNHTIHVSEIAIAIACLPTYLARSDLQSERGREGWREEA